METLEQTAHREIVNNKEIAHLLENGARWEACEVSFKTGAEWQKEQYKRLIEIASDCLTSVNFTYHLRLMHDLQHEIERLQD